MKLDPHLLRWARTHHQLVTRDAWMAAGHARRSFDRAAAGGALVRLHRNVAALPGATLDTTTRIAAAVLSFAGGVMASHRSGAYLWRAPVDGDDPVELITTRRAPTARAGIVVHRPTDLVDLRPVLHRGIPTTNPLRTLVDLGASASEAVAPTLEAFLIDRLVSPRAVRAALGRHAGSGHRGLTPLRQALEELVLGDKPPDSVLEPAFGRLLHRHGITGWVFHPRIAGLVVDLAFPAERLVIEVDGWAFHRSRERFERDRERDARLVVAGYTVLRFTWHQVVHQEARVADTVRRARLACSRTDTGHG